MPLLHGLPRYIGCLLVVAAVGVVAGCGGSSKNATVSGTIQIDGQPPNLDGLRITFLGDDGTFKTGDVSADGNFKVDDVCVGDNKVALAYLSAAGKAKIEGKKNRKTLDQMPSGKETKGKADLKNPDEFDNPLPVAVRDPHTTTKTFKVEAGKDNQLVWNVKSEPGTKRK